MSYVVTKRIDLDDIVEHTARLVDEGGRESLSLAALAESLGVKTSALYNHVSGIDGVWHELAVHSTNRLADVLIEAAVARSRGVALRAVANEYRRFAVRHPGQFASLLLPPTSAEDALNASHKRIIDVFVRVVSSFDIVGDESVHAARTIRSAIHGFVALESIDGMPSAQQEDVSFELMLDSLVSGLSPA